MDQQPSIPEMSRDTTASDDIIVETGIYRVALGQLRPLPMRSNRFPEGHILEWRESRIEAEVIKVLEQHGLQKPRTSSSLRYDPLVDSGFSCEDYEDSHVQVINRWPESDPDSKRPTIRVQLEWNEETSFSAWPEAVREAHQAVKKMQLPVELDIEFVASSLLYPVHIYPVVYRGCTDDHDALEQTWNGQMLNRITGILQESPATRDLVNLVTLCRLSNVFVPRSSPITVYIAMHAASKERAWVPVVHRIKSCLRRKYHCKIGVLMEHNGWELPGTSLDVVLEKRGLGSRVAFHREVNLGSEIGCTGHVRALPGTLGCYLEVKRDGCWSTVALTNYHVVRPLLIHDDALVRRVDRDGITPGEVEALESLGTLENPSQRSNEDAIEQLEIWLSGWDRQRPLGQRQSKIERECEDRRAYFRDGKNILGILWAASGFSRRSAQGHALDWALIDVRPERRGKNIVTFHDDWIYDYGSSEYVIAEPEQLIDPQSRFSLGSTEPGDELWRMTAGELVVGIYSRFRSYCSGGPQGCSETTMEHSILPCKERKGPERCLDSVPGDSGSIVYGYGGVIVGLVSRGMNPLRHVGGPLAVTIVTPIEDVFDDIKALTGVEEIRVLGGQGEMT